MRKRTAVVADDITGANDIGSMFAENGLVAGVFPFWSKPDPADFEGLDVVVIDTDSRFDPPQTAAAKVRKATKLLQPIGFDLYINKTCSVFRGNIGAEFDAMQDTLGVSCSMVVLGFPANGRTTLHGIHYLNGVRLDQSGFVRDPIHPTLEAELVKIIGRQSSRPAISFPYELLDLPLEDQRRKLEGLRKDFAYVVFDVRDQEDLRKLAVLLQDERNICGSSAIGRELPPVWGMSDDAASPAHPVDDRNGTLILAGSLTAQTAEQVQTLWESGCPHKTLDTLELFEGEARERQILELSEWACERLQSGGDALIHTDHAPEAVAATKQEGLRRGLSGEEVGKLISQTLGGIARKVLETTGGRKIVVAGGDTSAAVSRNLGVRKMVILREIEPGVPSMYGYGDFGELLMVLKSGSFGSSRFLENACAALRRLQEGTL